MRRYTNFGGGARRRFLSYLENTGGVVVNLPPPRAAWVKGVLSANRYTTGRRRPGRVKGVWNVVIQVRPGYGSYTALSLEWI